mgnify:CR=1 FL=1
MKNKLINDARCVINELIEAANLKKGDVLVIGCSSSEIMGDKIGTNSDVDAAKTVFDEIYGTLKEKGIYIASQCCEHLNRAIVIEKELAEKKGLETVNVVPKPKAGGSFATKTYEALENPCVVEHIKADAGLDIGGTLIGMHLKAVAVPVRLSLKKIGEANILCARTRPKFIGGIRAHYDENLL